ncbi:MAG: glycosyltransferase, partial [Amphiplicatus sp.]
MTVKFSVITPSFNQAEFLPRALASVAEQTLAPIEHLVFDPGSTDGSRNIASQAPGVTLIAEADRGQADAVARGMMEANGDIIAWLNSDDEYYDGDVFSNVASAFASDGKPDIIFGDGVYTGKNDEFLRDAYVIKNVDELPWRLAKEVGILQPATFISKSLINRIGPVNRDLNFCMDYEFWIRACQAGAKFMRLERKLAKARYYADNKTMGQRGQSLKEVILMTKKSYGFAHYEWIKRLADYELNQNDGILKNYTNNAAASAEDLELRTKELCSLINGDYRTFERIRALEDAKLAGKTLAALDDAEAVRATDYAAPIDEKSTTPGARCYTVGAQRWAFDREWLDNQLARSDALIEKLIAKRKHDVCVIAGNGPSLKKSDLDALKDADLFITNYAFLDKKLASLATYLCVTNYLVAEQEPESFNLLSDIVKFAPYWLSYCILPTENTCYIRSIGYPKFGTDYRDNISWRSTVSFFSMQMAYALGYKKVLLIGFDNTYSQPKSVEGDVIYQEEDDPNHFDSRYFKGKKWQAADTDNMGAMYLLAREAFEKDGREIVNCTVGGKLGVFRRGDLAQELDARPQAPIPRMLLIDHTRIGDATATGELKAQLFASWPEDRLLQMYAVGADSCGFHAPVGTPEKPMPAGAVDRIGARVSAFAPDIVLYRPTPNTDALHAAALRIIDEYADAPLALWIMDDWPSAMPGGVSPAQPRLNATWRALLARSSLNLGISEAMSEAFAKRYGAPFTAFANGVNAADWPRAGRRERAPVVVRYAGSLAENMTLASLRMVGEAIEALVGDGVEIRLEIKTRALWREVAAPHFSGLSSTKFIVADLSPEAYRAWLSQADVVVIAYNFDDASKTYTRYSLANKLPECLASGAALLAVGPSDVATMALLDKLDCGVRVTENSVSAVKEALAVLAASADKRFELADKAQQTAFRDFDINMTRARFAEALSDASAANDVSGLPREALASVDETGVVS